MNKIHLATITYKAKLEENSNGVFVAKFSDKVYYDEQTIDRNYRVEFMEKHARIHDKLKCNHKILSNVFFKAINSDYGLSLLPDCYSISHEKYFIDISCNGKGIIKNWIIEFYKTI